MVWSELLIYKLGNYVSGVATNSSPSGGVKMSPSSYWKEYGVAVLWMRMSSGFIAMDISEDELIEIFGKVGS